MVNLSAVILRNLILVTRTANRDSCYQGNFMNSVAGLRIRQKFIRYLSIPVFVCVFQNLPWWHASALSTWNRHICFSLDTFYRGWLIHPRFSANSATVLVAYLMNGRNSWLSRKEDATSNRDKLTSDHAVSGRHRGDKKLYASACQWEMSSPKTVLICIK